MLIPCTLVLLIGIGPVIVIQQWALAKIKYFVAQRLGTEHIFDENLPFFSSLWFFELFRFSH